MRSSPIVLLTALLAATAAAAAAPIVNPCKLLTPAEASAAIGQTLVRSDVQHYGPITRCRFFNAAGDEPFWLDAADAATFEGLEHLPDAKPIAGIGERALWQHDQLSTFLHILKGGNMISMGLPRTLATLTPGVQKAEKLLAGRM